MSVEISNWKEFRVGDLFDIHPTKTIEGVNAEMCNGGKTPLVVNQSYNNGVAGMCNFEPTERGGIITFSDTWEGNTFFYQPEDFIGFAHVQGMYPKQYITPKCMLFLCTMLDFDARGRFSYGRKKRRDIIAEVRLKLPADNEDNPDWEAMELYIDSLHHKPLTTKNKSDNAFELDVENWKEFRFGDLISNIYKARAINKDDLTLASDFQHSIRYITRTEENNGCELLADVRMVDEQNIENGNAISIGDTTATCFYQDEKFITGDHMVVVRANNWLNKYTALFVLAILNNERYKYSYGRAFLMDRIKETIVKLPATSTGSPDWQFMENYIKAQPYGDRLD